MKTWKRGYRGDSWKHEKINSGIAEATAPGLKLHYNFTWDKSFQTWPAKEVVEGLKTETCYKLFNQSNWNMNIALDWVYILQSILPF